MPPDSVVPDVQLPELTALEPRDYHITVDELREWRIPEDLPSTDSKLQTSMKGEQVPHKVHFLEFDFGIRFPDEWFELDGSRLVRPDFYAPVHAAYTLASKLASLRGIQEIADRTDAESLLRTINVWMVNRIEREFGWRRGLPSLGMNVEGFFRRNGAVVNPDQKVSEAEMRQVVDLFRTRFRG